MAELKPCPFCGSNDVGGSAVLGTLIISCYRCDAEVRFKTVGDHTSTQMKKWNTRTQNKGGNT